MTEQEARELVVKAGLELVESGLIVRTWGNVSCRLDEERFVITPSGRAYEILTPDDLVVCSVADASYTGDVKPSSEKGVHALIYRNRPEANFVIHTHQKFASAAASSPVSTVDGVPVAAYGLPSTKKIVNGVEAALPRADHAVLMAHHGAVCFGPDYQSTFQSAHALEQACEKFMQDSYLKASGAQSFDKRQMLDYYVHKAAGRRLPEEAPDAFLQSSRRDGGGFIAVENGKETHYEPGARMPDHVRLHASIYAARPDIQNIELSNDDYVVAVSYAGRPLTQLLDDFAQMTGKPMKIAADPKGVVAALGKTQGVLIPGIGALCCAANPGDAHAVALVTEKDALAMVCASLLGTPKPLSAFDCFLMHLIYTKSYAKKAGKE